MKISASALVGAVLLIAGGLINMKVQLGQLVTSLQDIERRISHIEAKLDRSELAENNP